MKTHLYIGQSNLRGAISRYATRFNLLELRAEVGRLPRMVVLRRWTEEVPNNFAFSVMLSRQVGRFGPSYETELALGLNIAEAVKAKWLVVQTDPTVGPSQRSRQRLQELFLRLMDGGRSVAWEPHGVWQDDEAAAWTRELGVNLVRDISRGDVGRESVVYSRMPGLGTASRISAGALEHAASNLIHASEAYVVVCGSDAGKVSQLMRGLVQDNASAANPAWNSEALPEVFGEFSLDDELSDDESEVSLAAQASASDEDNGEDAADDNETRDEDTDCGDSDEDDEDDANGPAHLLSAEDLDGDFVPRAFHSLKKRPGVKRR